WQPLIDPRHYRRNLFDGLDSAPVVAADDILVVVDCAAPMPGDHGLAWLRTVGLDRSTPVRGIAVLDDGAARRLAAALDGPVALYRPVTRRYTAPARA
ncbi:MAG: hypothetical protein HY060_13920, partial [Proteobacteria bacterium]|nr:hypothetical protein [Pseudomonadota bacterium]